ncbi:luciferase family protein [Gemmatimonas sp.]|uniref:luciferase domain-containing protein n=1 Tax=Gemmatimonas sp. TaxID=1962908 RepID=UPI0035697F03
MGTTDLGERVAGIVKHWDGVEVRPYRFGGFELRVAHREIGHVHLGGVADLLMTVRMRRDLVAAGRAEPHRTQPHSGWISFRMRSEHDVPAAVNLFRLNYKRLRGIVQPRSLTFFLTTPRLLADRISDKPAS